MINCIRNLKNTKIFLLIGAVVAVLAAVIAALEWANTLFDFWGNISPLLSGKEFPIKEIAITVIVIIAIIILAVIVYKQRHQSEHGALDESVKSDTLTVYIDDQKYEFTLVDVKPVDGNGNGEGGSFIDLSFKCEDSVHKCWYTLSFYVNEDLRVGKKCTNDYEQFSISRWIFDGTKSVEQRYELFNELNCFYFLKLTYKSNILRRYQGILNAKAYSVSAYERAFHHNAFFDKKYYAEIKSHKETSTGNETCKFDFTLPYDSDSPDLEEEEVGCAFDESF